MHEGTATFSVSNREQIYRTTIPAMRALGFRRIKGHTITSMHLTSTHIDDLPVHPSSMIHNYPARRCR